MGHTCLLASHYTYPSFAPFRHFASAVVTFGSEMVKTLRDRLPNTFLGETKLSAYDSVPYSG